MSIHGVTVVLALGSALMLAAQSKDERVRAKEPTVVTVYGTRENVATEKAAQPPRSVSGKVGHRMKSGFAAIGKGIAGFGGWLLNTDDDIPRQEERQRANTAQQQR